MPLIDSDLPSAKTLPPKKIVFSKTFEKAYKRCKASGRYDLSNLNIESTRGKTLGEVGIPTSIALRFKT